MLDFQSLVTTVDGQVTLFNNLSGLGGSEISTPKSTWPTEISPSDRPLVFRKIRRIRSFFLFVARTYFRTKRGIEESANLANLANFWGERW